MYLDLPTGGFWTHLCTSKRLFIDTSWKVLVYGHVMSHGIFFGTSRDRGFFSRHRRRESEPRRWRAGPLSSSLVKRTSSASTRPSALVTKADGSTARDRQGAGRGACGRCVVWWSDGWGTKLSKQRWMWMSGRSRGGSHMRAAANHMGFKGHTYDLHRSRSPPFGMPVQHCTSFSSSAEITVPFKTRYRTLPDRLVLFSCLACFSAGRQWKLLWNLFHAMPERQITPDVISISHQVEVYFHTQSVDR